MLKYFVLVVLSFFAVAWTTSLAPVFNLEFVNFGLLIGLIYFLWAQEEYIVWVFVFGFLLDLLSPAAFGVITFSLLITILAWLWLASVYRHNDSIKLFVLAAVGVLVFELIKVFATSITTLVQFKVWSLSINSHFWLSMFYEFLFLSLALILIQWLVSKKKGSFIH